MIMYQFLLNLWINGRVDENKLQTYVVKDFITQEEYKKIVETPQA
jgi:hypothetical protein